MNEIKSDTRMPACSIQLKRDNLYNVNSLKFTLFIATYGIVESLLICVQHNSSNCTSREILTYALNHFLPVYLHERKHNELVWEWMERWLPYARGVGTIVVGPL